MVDHARLCRLAEVATARIDEAALGSVLTLNLNHRTAGWAAMLGQGNDPQEVVIIGCSDIEGERLATGLAMRDEELKKTIAVPISGRRGLEAQLTP